MYLETDPSRTITVEDQDPVPKDTVNEVARRSIQHHQLRRHAGRPLEISFQIETEAPKSAGRVGAEQGGSG